MATTALSDTTIAKTATGQVAGAWADEAAGIRVFKGVPFAAPPLGDLRWRPPAPPAAWQGVRDATAFRDGCSQHQQETNFVWSRVGFPVSEDCLYLNVWAPPGAAATKPVMVWFHGGGHTVGLAHAEVFDGTQLARQDVVVVTVGYRLGSLGFLAHPAFAAESPQAAAGNYGLLDKVAALQWVQQNIAGFGGDPDNVTIFGQSAGSMSVGSLMASPLAAGLFHKAIGQSAGPLRAMTDGRAHGLKFAAHLGIDGQDAAAAGRLRAVPAEQLLAAEGPSGWTAGPKTVADGWFLPTSTADRFANHQVNYVPLLVGSAANEGNQLFPLNSELTEDALRVRLTRDFGVDGAAALLKAYRNELATSAGLASRELATDQFMAWGMRSWADANAARNQPTWLYFLDHVPPAFRIYQPDNQRLDLPGGSRSAGAYHSSDLVFVFGNVGRLGVPGAVDWNDDDRWLADTMSRLWTNFAKTGDPNGDGLPAWDAYSTDTHATLRLNAQPTMTAGVRTEKLDLLDRLSVTAPTR